MNPNDHMKDPLGMAGNYLDKMINDHIQAYPYFYTHKEGHIIGKEGMSLRDYFAGQAMSFMAGLDHVDNRDVTFEDIAKHSYELADAMLKAREAN